MKSDVFFRQGTSEEHPSPCPNQTPRPITQQRCALLRLSCPDRGNGGQAGINHFESETPNVAQLS